MADLPMTESGSGRWSPADLLRWDVTVGALLVVLVAMSYGLVGHFGNALNISFLIGNTLPVAFIALPMCMLVVAGEIDLSVGSMVGLSSAVMGELWNGGWPIEAIIPVCVLVGAAGGLLNGLLVTRLGLPSLAVTIGTLAAYRGIAQIILGANAVTDFPDQYLQFGSGRFGSGPIPKATAAFAVLLVLAVVVLHASSFGRALFAIGASREAAFFAGLPVKRYKLTVFVLTGMVSAATGVFWTLHYATARYDNANGLELSVVAAVLLGGVDFDGGKGTVGGVVAGVFVLGVLQNVMSLRDVSSTSQSIVTGTLLVLSVLAPRAGRQLATAGARRKHAGRPPGSTAPARPGPATPTPASS
jgi:rhamnose transport system permease protein